MIQLARSGRIAEGEEVILMEPERTITERRTYWESLARKTSRVHVTDFEMGVLYGMSMKVDIERAQRAQKESEKRDA